MSNTSPNVSPVSQAAQPGQPGMQLQPATPPQTTRAQSQATRAQSQATPAQQSQMTQEAATQPATRAQPQAPPQQQATPAVIPIPRVTGLAPEPKTRREQLKAGDAHWKWKLGLRAILIIIGIIGIGCAAWTVSYYGPGKLPWYYELDDTWSMPWTLITFSISVIWSFVCIAVFLMRRPNAPVHPGCQVAIDLILWLAFIATATFAAVAVSSVMRFGSDGTIGSWYRSSSAGYYTYAAGNKTWVWQDAEYGSYYYGDQRSCNNNSSSASYYYGDYGFATCEEEDAFVNALWRGKNQRFNTELTATVCQFIGLALHLALFIWACVDTHYKNKKNVCKEAEQLAADIVMNIVRSGAVIPPPGVVYARPMRGSQMMPPQMIQGYPQQYHGQYPQQWPQQYPQQKAQEQPPVLPPQPAVASSSNEKGAGMRYA